jgi:outer membrane cobalamin receptor
MAMASQRRVRHDLGAEASDPHPSGPGQPPDYAFLHPRDEGTGKAIPKKPKHVVNAAVEYTLARGEIGVPFGLVSSVRGRFVQFYLDEISKLNRQYLVIDARVAFELAIHREMKGEAFVSLNNVLNRDYEIAEGYPMPPRSFSGGVSLSY